MELSPSPRSAERPRQKVRDAFALERQGRFAEVLSLIDPDWKQSGIRGLELLPKEGRTELALRFAIALGYEGHTQKLPDAQMQARNVLTALREQFAASGAKAETVECENHIALTYWRTGEFAEALVWLDTADGHSLESSSLARLATVMIRMIVDIGRQRFQENIDLFTENECAIRDHGDHFIKGSCYLNLGISYFEIGRPHDALRAIELAKYFYENGEIDRYLGAVENELAHVYLALSKFEQAHYAVDNGMALFARVNDATREGFLHDTKASIYLAQGEMEAARTSSDRAIRALRESENKGFLAESLITRAEIASLLETKKDSDRYLEEALALAEFVAGEAFAKELGERFDTFIARTHASGANAFAGLLLVFPEEWPVYKGVTAVRISSARLKASGLKEGDLVITAQLPVERGDLVAARLAGSGDAVCGYFDQAFGMICLEDSTGSPLLFDEAEIEIVGKVIGYVRGDEIGGDSATVLPIPARPSSAEV